MALVRARMRQLFGLSCHWADSKFSHLDATNGRSVGTKLQYSYKVWLHIFLLTLLIRRPPTALISASCPYANPQSCPYVL